MLNFRTLPTQKNLKMSKLTLNLTENPTFSAIAGGIVGSIVVGGITYFLGASSNQNQIDNLQQENSKIQYEIKV